MNIKGFIRSMPLIGPLSYKLRPSRAVYTSMPFKGSAEYWERRYAQGGNSGAGSYNRLAEFKAEVINRIVHQYAIETVIEFGCGDGNQLQYADYKSYVGVDVSETILTQVRERFAGNPRFKFIHSSDVGEATTADLGLSLDVIYHLVEDEAFDTYMRALFAASRKLVIIYASNKDERTDSPHVRHRRFTDWVEFNARDFRLEEVIPNRYSYDPLRPDDTSFADFYVFTAP